MLAGDGAGHEWTGRLATPVALRTVELVACVGAQEEVLVQDCGPYNFSALGEIHNIHRYQYQVPIRLVAAATGVVAWQEPVKGSAPRTCQLTEFIAPPYRIWGGQVAYEAFELWLSKFVLGTTAFASGAGDDTVQAVEPTDQPDPNPPESGPAPPTEPEVITSSENEEYEIAFEEGYEDGYNDGLTDGERDGYHDGYTVDDYEPDESSACSFGGGDGRYGRSVSHLTASEEGFDEGYDQGYCDGYLDSYPASYDEGYEASPCGPSSRMGMGC